MPNVTADPRWPRLLSLAVHEFRTPMTVVAGYIRMLLKDRAGPLSDQQRRLLEEAEKSCGRLSFLLSEISELSNLEAGTATFNRSTVALGPVLADAIAELPPMPDRDVRVELSTGSDAASVHGDPVRLKTTFASIIGALRRELVTSDVLFVRERPRTLDGRPYAWVALADADHIEGLSGADASALGTFDEWRSGCGLGLAIARRVVAAHEGRIWSPGNDYKASAVVALPLA